MDAIRWDPTKDAALTARSANEGVIGGGGGGGGGDGDVANGDALIPVSRRGATDAVNLATANAFSSTSSAVARPSSTGKQV